MLELIVDGLIVVLLVALLALGIILRGRLDRLRGPGGELRELVGALDAATGRAESVLGEFRQCAADSGTCVEQARERLTALSDDLRLLTERADREADRLAELISGARQTGRAAVPRAPEEAIHELERDQVELERTLRSLR